MSQTTESTPQASGRREQSPMDHTTEETTARTSLDIIADLEATLDQVAEANPRIGEGPAEASKAHADLKALLEISLAINSSLVLDDVLQIVMRKAIELMQAERGLIMLLDEFGELQVKSAYNICKEDLMQEDFKVSTSVTSQVAITGKSVYTSDALADERYSQLQSVVELHLRSIMCVPIKIKNRLAGVIYLDNSNQAKMFLKSDLYLFELYAQLVANALHNAGIYDSLLRLKSYNESVINNSPVGIIVVDARGRITTMNPVALEILDINKDRIALTGDGGKPTLFLDVLPERERTRWQNMINTALTTGQEFSDSRYFHNTGYLEKALSLKISPISEMPAGSELLIMTMEDITEKVIMEKYVILSEKLVAKGEMAASVAHELNNFLAIVSNNAELLVMNLDREKFDKARFNSQSITENILKIKRFVNSLMDFSKPEPDYISYDIKHLIEDLLFSLRVQPRFKRSHFTIDLGHDIPNIEVDVGQVQQVLMNLLNNAADAIEEKITEQKLDDRQFKREIGITADYDKEGERLILEIQDNGIGMSDETLKKIFAVHFTTKKGGHGLGLANCRKIINNHHGEMIAESKLGEGTTFRIILPRFQPKKLEPAE
jgi:two-component system NtrC family sensor kinase